MIKKKNILYLWFSLNKIILIYNINLFRKTMTNIPLIFTIARMKVALELLKLEEI